MHFIEREIQTSTKPAIISEALFVLVESLAALSEPALGSWGFGIWEDVWIDKDERWSFRHWHTYRIFLTLTMTRFDEA